MCIRDSNNLLQVLIVIEREFFNVLILIGEVLQGMLVMKGIMVLLLLLFGAAVAAVAAAAAAIEIGGHEGGGSSAAKPGAGSVAGHARLLSAVLLLQLRGVAVGDSLAITCSCVKRRGEGGGARDRKKCTCS